MDVGSSLRVSTVERAVMPKPCRDIRHVRTVATVPMGAYQWCVVHAKHHYTLMLRRVLCDAAQVCFCDVIPVQKRHLAVGFYPHLSCRVSHASFTSRASAQKIWADLELGVLGEVVKRTDVQHEFSTLGELAEAGAEADEVRAGDGDAKAHGGLGDVEDTVLVEPEAVRLVFAVDELDEVAPLRA